MTVKTRARRAPHPNLVAAETADENGGGAEATENDDYYSEDSATLGDRIAAARMNAGLTQAGLARQLGVTARLVSSWENDRSEPRANRLAMLSGLVGVSVAWLLAGRGEGVASPDEQPGASTAVAESARLSLLGANLEASKAFYRDTLGCAVVAESGGVLDLDVFGVPLVLTFVDAPTPLAPADGAPLDGEGAPLPHLGIVLSWSDWTSLVDTLRTAGLEFLVDPAVHGIGEPRERAIFMVRDPDGNALAFRATRDISAEEA